MQALVKKHKDRGIWLENVQEPVCGDQDVLIKIWQTSICGSDIHIYNWDEWSQKTIPVPLTTGHEFMGEVYKLGKLVTGLKTGQRVSGEGHLVCGVCRNCRAGQRHLCIHTLGLGIQRPGCFAEFLSLPATNVFPLPDSISDDEATILDPLGNAVHTALAFDLIGEDVLVTGAGPIGIMAALIAGYIGARNVVITDVQEHRLALAKKCGIKNTINSKNMSLKEVMANLNMTEGFDVGLEMSGNAQALKDMIEFVRGGAKIALLGIFPAELTLEWNQIVLKGLTLKGIYGRQMFETWYKMCSLLQSGVNIKPIITHRFSYKDFQKGFEAMASGKSGKVVLDWRNS